MPIQRLPVPGQDNGTWGDILNGFLEIEHNDDGSLKIRSDGSVPILASGKVPATNLGSGTASSSNYLRGDGTWSVPNSGSSSLAADTDVAIVSPSNGQVLTYNNGATKWQNQALPTSVSSVAATDATITVGGTSTAPTVGVNAIPESKVTNLTIDLAAKANSSSLATVATSGSYTDLSNKPSIAALDATATDIQPDTTTGAAIAGSTGKAADAGHQHTLVSHDHSSTNKGGAIPEASVTNLTTDLAATEKTTNKGVASGYAPLNGSSQVPIANIPTGSSSSTVAIGNDARFAGSAAGTSNASLAATDATTTNSRAPNGSASGDLSGTYPGPTVAKVQGIAVSGTAPSGSGQVLTTTSTSAANWQTPTAGSQALTTTSVKTTTYSAAAGDLIPADATSAGFTVTLPTAPADKTKVLIKKIDSSANVVTIATGGSDVFNKTGGATTATLSLQNQAISVQYTASTSIWYVVGDDLPLSQLNATYAPLASPALTGTPTAPTATSGDSTTKVATTAFVTGAVAGVTAPITVNVKQNGAKGDGKTITDGAMTSGSATLTSATAAFTPASVGKTVIVANATSTAFRLATQIAAVGSGTSITLAAKAKATQTVQTWKIDCGRSGTDAVTTNDSATMTAASGGFAAVDVGRQITVTGAGRKALITTISAYTNATTVTLAASATRTCSGEQVIYGTDDTTALSTLLAVPNQILEFPAGTYLATTSLAAAAPALQIATGVTLRGSGWNTVLQSVEPGTSATTEFMGTNFYNGGSSDPTTNINNITIENLHIRGTAVESGFLENVPNLLSLNAASDVLVRNVKFSNFRSDAIYLGSGSAGNVERHNERIRIENCLFDGINNDNRNAISVIDGVDVSILGCQFVNVASDTMPGAIDVEPNGASGAYPRIRGIRVEDCYFARIGGDTGVIGWAIQVADSTLTYAAQGFTVINNTLYDCFNSTAAFFASQAGAATAGSRPANILITGNTVINRDGSLGRGTNFVAELENIIGLKFTNNIISDTYSSFLIGYSTTCFSIEVTNNTFRNVSYGETRTIEIVNANDVNIEDNLFFHCPGTICAFYIGSGSAGSSDNVNFVSNIVKQGGSNVTTAIAVKHASHTLTNANDLQYYGNQTPNNAALAIAPFISRTTNYTVTTGALTVDASLVPDGGTVIFNTSTTSAAGVLTVSNPVVGQIITFQFFIGTINFTYALAANMHFAGGAAATHTTAAGKSDIYTMRYDGSNWTELARAIAVG
jgi:hypothetical protein